MTHEDSKNLYQFIDRQGAIYIEYVDSVNYAMYHNSYPTMLKCEIANDSDVTFSDVEISVTGDFIKPCIAKIDRLAPKSRIDITELVKIDVDPAELIKITESVRTHFLVSAAIDGLTVLDQELPIRLMTFDHCPSPSVRPELLASFVIPNHPLLSRVAVAASHFMQEWTGSSALDEYQSLDPNRARMQVAAIYEALRSEALVYVTPPASFEREGQRIRTVDKVLTEKLGTCVDLALLVASCLESIGINPILIITKGHCLVGAWLVRDSYVKAVGDDADFLIKSASDGINEIVMFEATCITSSNPVTFDQAVTLGQLKVAEPDALIAFIDVYRARVSGVRPLPQRVITDGVWQVANGGIAHDNATTEVKHLDRFDLTEYDTDSAKVTKYTIWERKLLDFSLRNNLLDIKFGKKIIPLVSFSIDKLEDALQAGETFTVYPFPTNDMPQPSEGGLYSSSKYPQLEEFIVSELSKHRLHSYLDEQSLKESLKHDYRESRTSLEENGANNLYLVLGVMKWLETERSTKPRYAPILLLPIEIKRGGGTAGYVIRTRDEDIVLNVTLVQLLKQQHEVDLSMLDELPTDQSGVDVKKIFAIIRDKIRAKKGWNVLDEALIGLFSFSKFVMWNDIHSNSALMHQNEIISSLVDGKLNIANLADDIDAREADKSTSPAELVLPIDVDSSQLEAVIASGMGRSFILYGPPGTGKSQTITNMIANALYHGKRVLFVAEKMAALSVVQARLEKIGLAPFCLELHSNKVTKQHFLRQMDEALSVTRTRTPAEYEQMAQELFDKRKELIGYIEALHNTKLQGSDLSLYDCITSYLSKDDVFTVELNINNFPELTRAKIRQISDRILATDTILKIGGRPSENPLRGLSLTDGSSQAEEKYFALLNKLKTAIQSWKKCFSLLKRVWPNIDFDSPSVAAITPQFLRVMLSFSYVNRDLLLTSLNTDLIKEDYRALDAAWEAYEIKIRLCATFSDQVMEADERKLRGEWTEINSLWFLPKFFKRRAFLKSMECYKKGFSAHDVDILLTELSAYHEKSQLYKEKEYTIQGLFPEHTHRGHENWSLMLSTVRELHVFSGLADSMAKCTGLSVRECTERIANGIDDHWEDYRRFLYEMVPTLEATVRDLTDTVRVLRGIADAEDDKDFESIAALSVDVDRWLSGFDAYKDWYRWCETKRWLDASGLSDISKLIGYGSCDPQQAAQVFEKSIYKALADRLINTNEQLRYFNGLIFNDTINRYRDITSRFQLLSKQMLFCKLAASIPSQTMEANANAEIGILKRNIKNGGRGTSIRKIIDQIPTLLSRLCPCMLMSPLSVAQYIDLKNEKFDIVIFDEASQMPTSEAVGAIARGKALVVVGDDKQMPPTSFFTTSSVGEDEAYIDDMDSILDDCISLSIPSKYLSWHYRSRHESLIAFSNAQYYDGRLYTFPSVDDRVSKVTLRHIDGVYDKGRSRSNVEEARAVVAEVMRRLADPRLSKLSIGIVSFSKVQQDKIEDILTDELSRHPELEDIAYNGHEPIFVKNLENVQGDERDVILFSVGYGPDKSGRVSMNFGPLNNKGGERRLNVAVSRSRYEMIVFSSLTSDMIDLRRSQAQGVVGLKKFLEFAESGVTVVPASLSTSVDSNRIAQMIAQMLKEHGYDTQLNVGRSQFRIDVAVVDPKHPDRFLLAILCDGPSYYATKTVRDREIVQSSVLQNLSWNVMRVWTLDWFVRREKVVEDILKRLEDIKHQAQAVPDSDISEAQGDDMPLASNTEPLLEPEEEPQAPIVPYVFAEFTPTQQISQPDSLMLVHKDLRKHLSKLVEVEQPITNGLIYKRVVKTWGLSRVTLKVQSTVDTLLRALKLYSEPNGDNGVVFWADKHQAESFGDKYRENSQRDISDIPYVEIENAMRYAISQQIAIEREDLKRLTAGQLGFARLGNNITAATEYALSLLLQKGVVVAEGTKIIYK